MHFSCIFIVIILSFIKNSLGKVKAPPRIKIGLPYSGKNGVLILSEETPVNSYLGIMETKDADNTTREVECRTENHYINIPLVYPRTYKIELAQQLDRETDNVFQVIIICSDEEPPSVSSTASFTIEVTDVNDNAPFFGQTSYVVNITEGVAIGTAVATITATDPDLGLNGEVSYSLVDDSEKHSSNFSVDPKTGQISTKSDIDREVVIQYVLKVIAADSGLPALSSEIEVRIQVLDVNDNPPIILTNVIHVKESQKPMEHGGKIVATDADSGKNAELVFSKIENSKSSSTTPFLVQSNGEILSAVTLDREQRSQYTMEVAVRDKGSPRQSSSATISIIVDDVNDNAPVIISPCLYDDNDFILGGISSVSNGSGNGFVTIDWFTPEGKRVVFKVDADDLDIGENGQLQFSIESATSGDQSNSTTVDPLFDINESTGEIFLGRFIRRNDPLQQVLNISVADKGIPQLAAFCALNITIDVDFSHLTTPKPPKLPKVKAKPNRRGRKYRNGASTFNCFRITYLTGHIIVYVCLNLFCVFKNGLLSL